METITLQVPESQVIEWVRQLSPQAKQQVLRAFLLERPLLPDLDRLDALVDYGSQRMRQLCAGRGIDWDGLSEEERQRLVDDLLHEA